MKTIIPTILSIFLCIGSAASSEAGIENGKATTPVLVGGYFVGGLEDGNWLSCEEFYNRHIVDMNNYEYDVYSWDSKITTANGSAPMDPKSGKMLTDERYDNGYVVVDLSVSADEFIEYDMALKAGWDLFPRPYREQDTRQENYHKVVRDILAEEGIESPDTIINQLIRVDLDGDGTDEVLIAADSMANGSVFEPTKKGDHAVVIFRRLVDGHVREQVVGKDLILEDSRVGSIYRHGFRVESVADLDGDGVMEVVIRTWYYEGESYGIFRLMNDRLELVAENGFGV